MHVFRCGATSFDSPMPWVARQAGDDQNISCCYLCPRRSDPRVQYEDRSKAAQREMSHTAAYEGNESLRQRNERRAKQLDRFSARRRFLANWER